MKKTVLFLTTLTFSLQTLASGIWVTTPEITSREKLHRVTESPSEFFKDVDLISLHEALLAHPISSSQLQDLLNQESSAQNDSVNGKFQASLEEYNQLISKLELVPNVGGIEKITLNARIRRAELSDLLNESSGSSFWKEAHAWSPDTVLSRETFAPPTIEKFKKLGATPRNRLISVEAPMDSSVFIDGNRLKFMNGSWTELIESGTHQVAVLTPGALWAVENINATSGPQKIEIKFDPQPAVAGSCDQPKFQGASFPWSAKLLVQYNGGACERIYDGHQWFTAKGDPLTEIAPSIRDPITKVSIKGATTKTSPTNSLQFDGFAQPEDKPWYKKLTASPWFWVGAGVIVAGTAALIIQSQQSGDTVVTPTNK